MNLSLNKLAIFFFSIFFSANLLAKDSSIEKQFPYQDDLAKTILQYEPDIIQSYQPGKLYLNTDFISFKSNGIFLATAEKAIALPILFSDVQGCYLQIRDAGIIVTCGNCGFVFEVTELVTYCPNCGHGQWPK